LWWFDLAQLRGYLLPPAVSATFHATAIFCLLPLADRAIEVRGLSRVWYFVGIAALCAVGVGLWMTVVAAAQLEVFAMRVWEMRYPFTGAIWLFMRDFMFWTVVALFYLDRRESFRQAERLHQVQRGAVERRRHAFEARLLAMQARVDPAFLLSTLRDIRRRYAEDPRGAEAVLDAAIEYLRTAMPHAASLTSTLARELQLVRGYVALANLQRRTPVAVTISVAAPADRMRFPALILQPLVATLLSSLPEGTAALRLDGTVEDRRIVLTLRAPTGMPADDAALVRLRERLEQIYGEAGQLHATRSPDGELRIELGVPRESAAADAAVPQAQPP
jgi:hypothetical protein